MLGSPVAALAGAEQDRGVGLGTRGMPTAATSCHTLARQSRNCAERRQRQERGQVPKRRPRQVRALADAGLTRSPQACPSGICRGGTRCGGTACSGSPPTESAAARCATPSGLVAEGRSSLLSGLWGRSLPASAAIGRLGSRSGPASATSVARLAARSAGGMLPVAAALRARRRPQA